tara:strand:- start:7742 stop:9358 length:1617 start_codon:yes stop_codon:yes gene_type:complete
MPTQTPPPPTAMNWERFKQYTTHLEDLDLTLDISRISFEPSALESLQAPFSQAFKDMEALEKGSIANPDEQRMVGHYWLRTPELSPTDEIKKQIEDCLEKITTFAQRIHSGAIQGAQGPFKNILCVGIGGSALGPQFVAEALTQGSADKMQAYFIDNTDPDGIDQCLKSLEGHLGETLVIITSKSGGTPEPRNGMLEAQAAYEKAGLRFSDHAVATTSAGSQLDKVASNDGFLERFPMWDWIGGRTSELAAVGLLPAALQGFDIKAMLHGAKLMDAHTRKKELNQNPAALLAFAWHVATNGKGEKDMVILPYKDRLMLLSRYLQQLVMESLGKKDDLQGNTVHQGIAVYGNKGSTDQHAYVQQLRDGVPNFFATFIEVLQDREGDSIEVEPGVTSGDYLQGFFLGTRDALSEGGRESITITVAQANTEIVGALIALYERAVGFYASLVGVNAYHQPGVEAGKKAAATTLELKAKLMACLQENAGTAFTAQAAADKLGTPEQTELIYKLLEHLAANPQKNVQKTQASHFCESSFTYSPS